jgi:hypothetical protein
MGHPGADGLGDGFTENWRCLVFQVSAVNELLLYALL